MVTSLGTLEEGCKLLTQQNKTRKLLIVHVLIGTAEKVQLEGMTKEIINSGSVWEMGLRLEVCAAAAPT